MCWECIKSNELIYIAKSEIPMKKFLLVPIICFSFHASAQIANAGPDQTIYLTSNIYATIGGAVQERLTHGQRFMMCSRDNKLSNRPRNNYFSNFFCYNCYRISAGSMVLSNCSNNRNNYRL